MATFALGALGRLPAGLLSRGGASPIGGALSSMLSWLPLELGAFLFAVPKKRVSKSRIRIRRHGQLTQRGPRLVTHSYICQACSEQKLPHRVCGRPDCTTTARRGFQRAWELESAAAPSGADGADGSGLAPA
jgi:ribosomal protein L32